MAVLELAVDRQFQSMMVAEALRDLGDLWSMIPNPDDGRTVRAVLEEYLPILIQTYGEPLAVQAATRFEEIRSMAGVSGRFTSLIANGPETDRINAHARRMIEPIFRGDMSDPDEAFRNLEGMTSRLVLEQSRRTTVENTFSKGSGADGFLRVPTPGRDNCGYCLLLATKVYRTKETAKAGSRGHNRCFCKFVPKYEAVEIEGHDMEEIDRQYQEAFKNSDGSLNDIAKELSKI